MLPATAVARSKRVLRLAQKQARQVSLKFALACAFLAVAGATTAFCIWLLAANADVEESLEDVIAHNVRDARKYYAEPAIVASGDPCARQDAAASTARDQDTIAQTLSDHANIPHHILNHIPPRAQCHLLQELRFRRRRRAERPVDEISAVPDSGTNASPNVRDPRMLRKLLDSTHARYARQRARLEIPLEEMDSLLEEERPFGNASTVGDELEDRETASTSTKKTLPDLDQLWPRVIFLHLQNGLGNRMRALASGLEFAFTTQRVPVIIWAPDAHLNATMADLFDSSVMERLVVVNKDIPWPPAPHIRRSSRYLDDGSMIFQNRMEKDTGKAEQQAALREVADRHIYLKTAYLLDMSPHAPDLVANVLLQSLTPSQNVLKIVDSLEEKAGPLDHRIGVHMRTRSVENDGVAVKASCEYSALSIAVANRWRAQSGPTSFIPMMLQQQRLRSPTQAHSRDREEMLRSWAEKSWVWRTLSPQFIAEWASGATSIKPAGFFVSSDDADALRTVQQKVPDVLSLPGACRVRERECVAAAFADMLALSRCGALLLSGWSSFSETAWRLRPTMPDDSERPLTVRFSGINFGKPTIFRKALDALNPRSWKFMEKWFDKDRQRRCSDKEVYAQSNETDSEVGLVQNGKSTRAPP